MYSSISSSVKKKNLLECCLCEDVYTVQGERIPRLLYCGHTICHACLLRLPIQDESIYCPFDRQSTPVGTAGVWALKKNFALLELLERLETRENETPTVSKGIDLPDNDIKCDEDESHVAVIYCIVCDSNLCYNCSEQTHSTRTLARHRRVSLAEKPSRCPLHPAHMAQFVCLNNGCQFVPLCLLCKDYGRHKDHMHSLLEVEAEKLRTLMAVSMVRIHQFIEQMNQTVDKLQEVIIGIEGDLTENTSESVGSLDAARERVESHFMELRDRLTVQEEIALSVIETYARERLATIRASQHDIGVWSNQVVQAIVQCETSMTYDDMRLVSNGTQLRKVIEQIEKQYDQLNQLHPDNLNPDIPITFTKDNRVHIGQKIEMRVVALGLDGAGKTSILFKLKQNEFMSVPPTIGFNVETIEYKNLRFNVWDIGGQPKLRPLWKHYFLNTQAVVFVIDSSDKERFQEASSELAKIVAEKDLKDAALLILANKQDLDRAEGVENLTELLGISKLCCCHSWHLQACSAQTGTGLYQGLDWLSSQLVASPVTSLSID